MGKFAILVIGFTMLVAPLSVWSDETIKAQTGSTQKAIGADFTKEERIAITAGVAQAIQSYFRTDPKERKGDEIPEKLWGEAITKLKPMRVMNDRVNVVIVLQDNDEIEQGLYVSLAISSYAPNYDKRFTTFEKLSKPEDKPFNILYRYIIKKTNQKTK